MLDLPVLAATSQAQLEEALIPTFGHQDGGKTWQVAVLYGPHGAPDFSPMTISSASLITRGSALQLQPYRRAADWPTSGVGASRRRRGGAAPSNIHDNAYAFGTIDFTGDMPVILGPDGPSLGGFVCPATVVRAERWKLGQLAAGDKVRFVPVSLATARSLEERQLAQLSR
ncbi:hypothetical protein HORIV_24950 [Vreelandella olivaria]|uniref:Carboxyltransferase domain-containing protein n=1 Tax=Vreelandella olivaria TaxID=390919 RepID=A0ABM7GHR3_9GAMM|nr:hypothetical protein HORIV_24950 [Halomonas olivaria]